MVTDQVFLFFPSGESNEICLDFGYSSSRGQVFLISILMPKNFRISFINVLIKFLKRPSLQPNKRLI